MEIMRRAGWIDALARRLGGVLHRIFPDIPRGHPAMGAISMNLAANMLGMGNAATPLGIKAMEQMQKLNTSPDTASAAMCMFLVMNTSSVQLIPTGIINFRHVAGSAQAGAIVLPALIATTCSTVVGIIVASVFRRLARRRGS
jgi:spore maturation protein A